MNDYDINPIIWFAERELEYPPAHFIPVATPVTEQSKQWVLDNLTGRFSITTEIGDDIFDLESLGRISFESPKDAVIFELKWS